MDKDFNIAGHKIFSPKGFKIFCVFLFILIIIHLGLWLSIVVKGNSFKELDAKWQILQPNKIELEKLTLDCAAAEKSLLPVKKLVDDRIVWSKKLNQISDHLVPGIWLDKIYIEENVKNIDTGKIYDMLEIGGFATPLYGNEKELLDKFVKGLQADADFSRPFEEIKPSAVKIESIENNPVGNFRVFCILRRE